MMRNEGNQGVEQSEARSAATLKSPPAGVPPAKTSAPGDQYDPQNPSRFYVPLLLDHLGQPKWLDYESPRVELGEFALCFMENVPVSYRIEEEKKRSFAVTSLGRIAIIKDGKLAAGGDWYCISGQSGQWKYSACDHVAALRELKLEGSKLTMELRGRAFVLKCKTPEEANKAVSAISTVALILFSGPPPFKLTNVDLKANQIVTPCASFIIGCNLPPGWEQGFSPDGKPYYINILQQTTTWTMPPDVVEQCNVSRLSKYPRWIDPGRSSHSLSCRHFILAPPPTTSPKSAPYWCAEGATNGFNGRTSTIIDLTILASKIVTKTDLGFGWVNEAFLPALKQALSANKLFTGITLSTPDRVTGWRSNHDAGSDTWFCRSITSDKAVPGLMKLFQVSASTHSELGFPLPCPEPPVVAARQQCSLVKRALGVQVWSGRHLPKADWFGKIDPYVKLYLVSGNTPDLLKNYRNYVKKEDGVKTPYINSNYHPSWHNQTDIGTVPWTRFEIKEGMELSTLRLLGIVKDHNTIKTGDVVGNIEIPVPPLGGETEGWYKIMDAKQKVIKGNDSGESEMYVRLRWLDANSSMEGMQVPGTPAGKLTCIDLSWRDDLAPNIAKYCLHHAGTLKTLKVAGISTHKGDDDISVVAEAIIETLHHPGWPMPAEWKGKLHFLMDAKNIFRTDQIVVIPSLGGWSGWTERATATAVTDGKKYYVHAASGQSRWAPPEAVFGKVTGRVQGEGSKDYYVDAGSGQPQVFNAGHLGMIAPICKGWGQFLRVLDMSCNTNWVREDLQLGLGRAIARMPALEELYLAGVPIAAVLREMHELSKSGTALPPIKCLDVAAAIGQRTAEESLLLPNVLSALRGSLSKPGAYLRMNNCILNAADFGNVLAALADVGRARGSDLQVAAPCTTSPEMEASLKNTTFEGGIYCCNMTVGVGAAVLRALACNTSVQRLEMRELLPDGNGLAGQEIRDALHAFLTTNSTVKKLDISANPIFNNVADPLRTFYPRWDPPPNSPRNYCWPFPDRFIAQFHYCNGDQGPGWYMSDAHLAEKFIKIGSEALKQNPMATQIWNDMSAHPAWALGALAQNTGLKELNVAFCDLGDAGFTAMGQVLRENRTLTSLKLDGNRVSLEGLKALKGCLYGNKKIVAPYPACEYEMLISNLKNEIGRQEQAVMAAKGDIKTACRGGSVQPWLQNPTLKAQALARLKEAKREQSQARRTVSRIDMEMKWIWGKMDDNAKRYQDQLLAAEAAKEQATYEKEMGQYTRMHQSWQSQQDQYASVQQARWERERYERDRYYHDPYPTVIIYNDPYYHHGGGYYGGGYYGGGCYGGGCYGGGYNSTSYYNDGNRDQFQYDPVDGNALIAADVSPKDLAAMDKVDAAAAPEAQTPEVAADLAEVEAYAGAGPRDLWGGGGGGCMRRHKVLSGCRNSGIVANNMKKLEEAERQQKMILERSLDIVRGTVACTYRTIAHFLRPVDDVEGEEVTLVTQASMDRLPRLEEQALALGNAPLSVAIYVPFFPAPSRAACREGVIREEEEEALKNISRLHDALAAKGVRRVTISLLFGNSPTDREYDNMYPINNLRNLALDAAQTRLVFLVDVDFVPSPQLAMLCSASGKAMQSSGALDEMCERGAVLVVPAFEVQYDVDEMPKCRKDLKLLCEQCRAEGFHVSNYPKGHMPTAFDRWFDTDAPYMVEYQEMYEPYIIACKDRVPRYDERFRGYGMNKVSHLYEVASRGVEFVVMPEVFIAAREHQRSHSYQRVFGEDRDPEHAVRIAVLWTSFKRQLEDRSMHFDKPRMLSPPPYPAKEEGAVADVMKEMTKDESRTQDPPCKGPWLFYPAKTRKVVRLSGQRQRRNKWSASPVARTEVQRSYNAAPADCSQ